MPDGRILAASRFEWNHELNGNLLPYPPGKMPNDHAAGHMVLMESSDEGRSWSEPREFLNYSEVQGQLTLLRDGRLVCTYTHYHLPFGVAAVVSTRERMFSALIGDVILEKVLRRKDSSCFMGKQGKHREGRGKSLERLKYRTRTIAK